MLGSNTVNKPGVSDVEPERVKGRIQDYKLRSSWMIYFENKQDTDLRLDKFFVFPSRQFLFVRFNNGSKWYINMLTR